jgi:hypothetical protein
LKTKTVVSRKTKAVDTDDVPTIEVEEIDSDAELNALKMELGLTESYSE